MGTKREFHSDGFVFSRLTAAACALPAGSKVHEPDSCLPTAISRIKKAPGATLQYYHREILQKDWNDRIENGRMPTLRAFARDQDLAVQTWKREYERGKTGETVPDPKRPGRKIYALYDAGKAQDRINEGHANKGAPMKVTNRLDAAFARLVKEMRLSPYDAVCRMKEDPQLEGSAIPCVRTGYNHIKTGDISVHYGETPYHPDDRRQSSGRSSAWGSAADGARRNRSRPTTAASSWTPVR